MIKRINIGIVLIIIYLIGTISYQIVIDKQREKDKVLGLEFVKKYFEIYNKYSVLEVEDRTLDKELDSLKFDNYIENMKSDISNYTCDFRTNYLLDIYQKRLSEQKNGKYMIYEYNKEIKSIKSCTFNNDYITFVLKISSKINKDIRKEAVYSSNLQRYIGNVTRQHIDTYITEIVCIKKVSDKNYKVVYHEMKDDEIVNEGESGIWLI